MNGIGDLISLRIITKRRGWWNQVIKDIKLKFGQHVDAISIKYNVPKEIIISVILKESGGNPKAYRYEKNVKDASYGLMQLLYKTAKGLGYSGKPEGLYDPNINIDLGTKFLSLLYGSLKDWHLSVAGYNAGMGRVNQVIKELNTGNWEDIILLKEQLLSKNPARYKGFCTTTIPYIRSVFGTNGILNEVIGVV